MPRILSLLILLATVGTLAADPIKKCVGDNEDLNRFEVYNSKYEDQIKKFNAVPGKIETKYNAFTVAFSNLTSLTKTFMDIPATCDEGIYFTRVYKIFKSLFEVNAQISEKEYLTSCDPRILKKIEDKYTEIDACYENSRNLTGINPKDESKINFCTYNMVEALDCTQKIFKNDQDEPLLSLNSFTNFFVTEYDCKQEDRDVLKDHALLALYQSIAKTSKFRGRQTFFHGYQQTVTAFI